MSKKIERKVDTPENKEYWDAVEKTASIVESWPDWKRAGINVGSIRMTDRKDDLDKFLNEVEAEGSKEDLQAYNEHFMMAATIDAMRDEIFALKELILEAEWVGTYCGFQVCPWCNGTIEAGAYKFQTGCHDMECRAFKGKGEVR